MPTENIDIINIHNEYQESDNVGSIGLANNILWSRKDHIGKVSLVRRGKEGGDTGGWSEIAVEVASPHYLLIRWRLLDAERRSQSFGGRRIQRREMWWFWVSRSSH